MNAIRFFCTPRSTATDKNECNFTTAYDTPPCLFYFLTFSFQLFFNRDLTSTLTCCFLLMLSVNGTICVIKFSILSNDYKPPASELRTNVCFFFSRSCVGLITILLSLSFTFYTRLNRHLLGIRVSS